MADPNFWKDAYQDAWEDGNRRERLVTEILAAEGVEVEDFGFAAGSEEYKEGRPERYGSEQGDPDLRVAGTDQYVEVTGTDLPVSPDAALWIRPDKIRNARGHPDRDEWVVHVLEDRKLFRAVHLTDDVVDDLLAETAERRIYPYINGNEEEYVAINPVESDLAEPDLVESALVEPLEAMVNYLLTGSRRSGPLSVPDDPDWATVPDTTMEDVVDGEFTHICMKVTGVEEQPFPKAAKAVSLEDADGTAAELVIWQDDSDVLRDYEWEPGAWYCLDGVKGNDYGGMDLKTTSSTNVTSLSRNPS